MYVDGACVILEFQDEAHEMMQMVEVVQEEEVTEIQIGWNDEQIVMTLKKVLLQRWLKKMEM